MLSSARIRNQATVWGICVTSVHVLHCIMATPQTQLQHQEQAAARRPRAAVRALMLASAARNFAINVRNVSEQEVYSGRGPGYIMQSAVTRTAKFTWQRQSPWHGVSGCQQRD